MFSSWCWRRTRSRLGTVIKGINTWLIFFIFYKFTFMIAILSPDCCWKLNLSRSRVELSEARNRLIVSKSIVSNTPSEIIIAPSTSLLWMIECNRDIQWNSYRYDFDIWFGRNSIGSSSVIDPRFQIEISESSRKSQWTWYSCWRYSIRITSCWWHIMTSIMNPFIFTFWIWFVFDWFKYGSIILWGFSK